MFLLRTSKGFGMVEVLVAVFLTVTAILAIFALQSPAWRQTARADYLGRATEIMHKQLESTEAYLMNPCNTAAVATNGIPVIPAIGSSASSTYTVYASGLAAATQGDASYTVATTITRTAANDFRVTVTVTWPPLNAMGITQTMFVSRQLYFKMGAC
jgi:Tfp pilus assembly protein PilV